MNKITRFDRTEMPFRNTGSFSKLIIDFFEKNEDLKALYGTFPDPSGVTEYLKTFKNTETRAILSQVVKKQYAGIPEISAAVQKNIELLGEKQTFTVTTGHQLNLFSGPLYILYKLLSAIRLAEELKKQHPSHDFVPVYWMATEDHDIAEINNLTLFNRYITYSTPYAGPAGKLILNDFEEVISEIEKLFGEAEHANEILSLMRTCYQSGKSLAEATRSWINFFLGKYGLIILNPDDAQLKKLFIPVMEDDLFNHTAFREVTNSIETLSQLNYPHQVQPREINLFYFHDEKRSRIVREGDRFAVVDTSITFSADEIKNELNRHPENFSPNVVLRPLYQQMILPNIAYVGGPAEVAYWMEFRSMFASFDINFPVLFLRNCFLIADGNLFDKFLKLGFTSEDIFKDVETLSKKYLSTNFEGEYDINKYSEKFAVIFDQLNKDIQGIDPTLISTAESEKQRLSNSLKQLEQKITRALKRKNETEINQIKKVKDRFFPGGNLQERTETMLPFLLKYGFGFIDMVYEQIHPFATTFTILRENTKAN